MNRNRQPQGTSTGGQFATSARNESGIRLTEPETTAPDAATTMRTALEASMGCGPGETLFDNLPDPYTGEPMRAPVGQTCRSSAHNYAYWDGTCQFAHEMAQAAMGAVSERLKAADADAAALERIDNVYDRYFDLDGQPGVDDTTPEREDVWRFDRDMREARAGRGPAPATERTRVAEEKLEHLVDYFNALSQSSQYTGNYDADMAHEHAIYQANGYIEEVVRNGVPEPRFAATASDEPPF